MRRLWLWSVTVVGLVVIVGTAAWFWLTANAQSTSSIPQNDTYLETLSVWGQVPDFTLVERSGRTVQLTDLRGKVWVVNFAYTQCTDTCPMQTANMARLQKDFAGEPDVRLVSISVDPAHDTPEFLREYASRYNADADRWLFLTGNKEAIYDLAIKGFRLGVVEQPDEYQHVHSDGTLHIHKTAAGERVVHSSRFVLIDRQAQIRAYFRGTEEEALARLRVAVRRLLQEP
ncbi:MAG: SCO family protein [Chloroflexota bacterium]